MTWLVVAGIMLAAFAVLWLISLVARLLRGGRPLDEKSFYGCETGSVDPVPVNLPGYALDICSACRRVFQTQPTNKAYQLAETCGLNDCPMRHILALEAEKSND